MRGISREAPNIIERTLCKLSNVASGQQLECMRRVLASRLQTVDLLQVTPSSQVACVFSREDRPRSKS